MRIGLDFDNTIVCYDQAIELLAEELLELPNELPRTKLALRDYLRTNGREKEWTTFQGELYGPGMCHARPFDGAINTMRKLMAYDHDLMIISHRSRQPYAGPPHDLHVAARIWIAKYLQSNGLFVTSESVISLLETRGGKLARISEMKCDVFVDDLTEVLLAPGFPDETVGILFDPSGTGAPPLGGRMISSWPELGGILPELVQ